MRGRKIKLHLQFETQVNLRKVGFTTDDTIAKNEIDVRIDTEYQPEAIDILVASC